MKTIFECTVTTETGRVFNNPLMLSELNLLNQLLKENKKVEIKRVQISKEEFKRIFGR